MFGQFITLCMKELMTQFNPVQSFLEIGENKNFDGGSSSENIDFNISSRRSDKSHIENKSGSDINLDKMVKLSFDEVDDNAIN